jgi:glycosyltransferase involved in cell wall biosynthesis
VRSLPTPLVSVVLPFRNAAATIREAVDSIRGQSLERFECILVDHRSEDASATVARGVARRDPRFRVVRADGSFVDALNRGVAEACAPLIARMDADDISLPARLERQVEALGGDPRLGLVSCLVECFATAPLAGGMKRYETWINGVTTERQIRDALFVESPLPHPSVTFRRSEFDRAGGYRDTGGPEDYDLWLRMILGGTRARKIPAALLRWRDSPTRLSRDHRRYDKRRFFETKLRHFPKAVPPTTPVQFWGTGPTARRWARNLRESGYEIRRFVDVVVERVGRTVQGLTVEPPTAIDRADGFVLAAVGLLGAREIIERDLQQRGLQPSRDYLAVA